VEFAGYVTQPITDPQALLIVHLVVVRPESVVRWHWQGWRLL
jgi:hypothetical protein